jgi:serine/threonine protein kinase
MELCDGVDLVQDMKKYPDKCYPQSRAIEYFKQIANGLTAIHKCKIAHRE